MKNKLIAILFATCTMLSVTACGGNDETKTNSTNTQQTENQQKESQKEEQEEVADDGIINFNGATYNVTYVKHEVSTDYDGNPCLLFYYTYTNNGEEASNASVDSYIKVFQNGIECESAFIIDNLPDSYDNYMKDVQPGYSLEICQAYSLEDMSDVTVEATELMSFDNKKDVQILSLE